ncbi:MAG: RnfABCDGE type electron transport complex subunit G, partial [Mucinivorans sp.]
MESNLKNMVIVLLVITLVAAGAVGGVYILTKEPIAKAKIEKTNAAIADVLPAFDNDPNSDVLIRQIEGEDVKVYPAVMGADTVGYAVETFSKNGFGGTISLLVGFNIDGTIKKISVLEQKETPGLGDKIEPSKSNFSVQFAGKDPASWKLMVRKDGGDVDAITASTISSRAFTAAVDAAYKVFCEVSHLGTLKADAASGATSTEYQKCDSTAVES